MNIADIKSELENARHDNCYRAALGSIIRRHYEEIKDMDRSKKKQFIKNIGATESYMSELYKELNGVEYDRNRTKNK